MNKTIDHQAHKPRDRRDANTRDTQEALIAAGRVAFAEYGFAGAALDAIVTDARVTTGALYHHFGNKKGLFRAVAESIEQEIVDDLSATLPKDALPWQQLEYGITRTLELCAHPHVSRILFREAPTVIGMREWREIELRYGLGIMRQTLTALEAAGELRRGTVDLTAQILLGALIEAAHVVAADDDPTQSLADARITLVTLAAALKVEPSSTKE